MVIGGWLLATGLLLGAAPFEGVVHQQLKIRGGEGTMKVHISSAGVRSEAELTIGPNHKTSTTVLITARAPGQAHVRDHAGSWKTQPALADGSALPPVLEGKKLGTRTIAGHSCTRVLLRGGETELEYCLAPKLLTPALLALVRKASLEPPQVEKALKALGVSGMVLQMIQRKAGTTEVTLTATRVEARKLEPALFAAPP